MSDAWGETTCSINSDAGQDCPTLLVDVEGYQGPLDLLLALARAHKIDIAQISILELVEQYLTFIDSTKALNLEIAADYLVMAAWLAYLKSRLLLPRMEQPTDEPSGEELAARLAFRLMRLQAMRQAAEQLLQRHRTGINVFVRGAPEKPNTITTVEHVADIYDLLKAYADQQNRKIRPAHIVKRRTVWSIKEARIRLEKLMGSVGAEWQTLQCYLQQYLPAPDLGPTVTASSLGATLEMAREGILELHQEQPFGPIYLRITTKGSPWRLLT